MQPNLDTPDVTAGARALRVLLGDMLGDDLELRQMAWAVLQAAAGAEPVSHTPGDGSPLALPRVAGTAQLDLSRALLGMDSEVLGETLRELVFTGDGYGCYSTFDVRDGAQPWPERQRAAFWQALEHTDAEDVAELARLGSGYTVQIGALNVGVCWYWDGDGVLAFAVTDGHTRRVVVNTDCKKDYGWDDKTPGQAA